MDVGATQVPVNPKSTGAELRGFVEQVAPVAVVSDDGLADLMATALGPAGGRRSADSTWASCSTPSPTVGVRPTSIRRTWR